jgi:hypothetical protein
MVALLRHNADFKADRSAARAEHRKVLGFSQ